MGKLSPVCDKNERMQERYDMYRGGGREDGLAEGRKNTGLDPAWTTT